MIPPSLSIIYILDSIWAYRGFGFSGGGRFGNGNGFGNGFGFGNGGGGDQGEGRFNLGAFSGFHFPSSTIALSQVPAQPQPGVQQPGQKG